MKLTIYFILVFCFCFIRLGAQNQFKPYNHKSKNIKEWTTFLDQQKKDVLQKHSKYKHQHDLKEYLSERHQDLLTKIESGHFYFDQGINDYFNSILSEILDSNPQLQKDKIRFLIARYNWPNASYHGDGIIVLNIGLIDKLNRDDEFAFIICHELAHHYFEHVDLNFMKSIDKIKSKETKKQIKAIKKSEYGKYTKGTTLLKGFVYNSRKHVRGHEFQADSLGFDLLKNTRYNPLSARDVLLILDTIDKEDIKPKIRLDSIFNFVDYPFQESWIKESTQMFGKADVENKYWNVDSLKTHPDCLKRIEALNFNDYKENGFSIDPQLSNIKKNLKYEMILYESEFGDAGRCMLNALDVLVDNPSDLFAISMISNTFLKILNARKNYTASEILMNPSQTDNERLKKVLILLSNMRSVEIANVNFYFLKNIYINNPEFRKNIDFENLFSVAAKESNKIAEFESIKNM